MKHTVGRRLGAAEIGFEVGFEEGNSVMNEKQVFAIIDRHFEFESPELIERVIETFAPNVIWESPARHLRYTNHDEIVVQYKKIIAGLGGKPKMTVLRRFCCNNEVFDDRLIYFKALKGNVWGVSPNKNVELRLVHYFKIENKKISHEIGYEMWHILK